MRIVGPGATRASVTLSSAAVSREFASLDLLSSLLLSWEHEVPGQGLLQLHYYTSKKWVDRDLRTMLCARCLVGKEVNSASTEEEQR